MEQRKANANPARAFFVRMLTRDISLEDCILDLVDNSVDSARTLAADHETGLSSEPTLAGYRVEITIAEDRFVIRDNCGGISLDAAADYAFTFGRQEDAPVAETSPGGEGQLDGSPQSSNQIGVYGIGMKRAVFKLGNQIEIQSTYQEHPCGSLMSFMVPIDVDEWVKDPSHDWDFGIDPADPAPDPGVEIQVHALHPSTSEKFDDPSFLITLRRILGRTYLLPLMRGLDVVLNGKPVPAWSVEFKTSSEFAPMRHSHTDDHVLIELIAGMAEAPPDVTDVPSEDTGEDVWGWYVACNGRLVLAADKTELSGWGVSFPKWHGQYAGFVGIALFSSVDPALLPMTTTKRSVDVASGVYRRARTHMQRAARGWIDYTNERKTALEVAHDKESQTVPASLPDVPTREAVLLPKLASGPPIGNILYKRPAADIRRLAIAYGDASMPFKEVGERTFDDSFRAKIGRDSE